MRILRPVYDFLVFLLRGAPVWWPSDSRPNDPVASSLVHRSAEEHADGGFLPFLHLTRTRELLYDLLSRIWLYLISLKNMVVTSLPWPEMAACRTAERIWTRRWYWASPSLLRATLFSFHTLSAGEPPEGRHPPSSTSLRLRVSERRRPGGGANSSLSPQARSHRDGYRSGGVKGQQFLSHGPKGLPGPR